MKRPVVLDADISSVLIRGRLPLAWSAKLVWAQPCMTFITRSELLQWTLLRNLGKQRQAEIRDWIAKNVFLPVSEAVTETHAELFAAAKLRGRPAPINDSWIAACCVSRRLPLATFNVKDFRDFAEYHGLEQITV